jgi:hypothetical protein
MSVAALVLPISGPYVGTWNALPHGTLSDDGYEVSCGIVGQEINESDAYGGTLVEWIYRGQNWRCRIRGLEWFRSGLLSALQTFGQTGALGTFNPQLLNVGIRGTNGAQTMLLTALLANPPCTPQSLTALNAVIAPNSQSSMLFTSKMREMPIEYVLIPYQLAGQNIPFSTT